IRVDSKTGEGSTFYFSIPCKHLVPVKTNALPEKIGSNGDKSFLNGKEILIAEDDLISFKFLKTIFDDCDVQIHHAETGKDAVEKAMQNPGIALILMDIKMPEMSGIEATREIRKRNTTVPILAQTAYAFLREKKE